MHKILIYSLFLIITGTCDLYFNKQHMEKIAYNQYFLSFVLIFMYLCQKSKLNSTIILIIYNVATFFLIFLYFHIVISNIYEFISVFFKKFFDLMDLYLYISVFVKVTFIILFSSYKNE